VEDDQKVNIYAFNLKTEADMVLTSGESNFQIVAK
jgi:hypothetical protein